MGIAIPKGFPVEWHPLFFHFKIMASSLIFHFNLSNRMDPKTLLMTNLEFVKTVLADAHNPFSSFFERVLDFSLSHTVVQVVLPSVGKKPPSYVVKTVLPAITWGVTMHSPCYGMTYIKDGSVCVDIDAMLLMLPAALPCLRATILHELAHAVRILEILAGNVKSKTPPVYAPSQVFHDKYGADADCGEMGLMMQEQCLGGISEVDGVRVVDAEGAMKIV